MCAIGLVRKWEDYLSLKMHYYSLCTASLFFSFPLSPLLNIRHFWPATAPLCLPTPRRIKETTPQVAQAGRSFLDFLSEAGFFGRCLAALWRSHLLFLSCPSGRINEITSKRTSPLRYSFSLLSLFPCWRSHRRGDRAGEDWWNFWRGLLK